MSGWLTGPRAGDQSPHGQPPVFIFALATCPQCLRRIWPSTYQCLRNMCRGNEWMIRWMMKPLAHRQCGGRNGFSLLPLPSVPIEATISLLQQGQTCCPAWREVISLWEGGAESPVGLHLISPEKGPWPLLTSVPPKLFSPGLCPSFYRGNPLSGRGLKSVARHHQSHDNCWPDPGLRPHSFKPQGPTRKQTDLGCVAVRRWASYPTLGAHL